MHNLYTLYNYTHLKKVIHCIFRNLINVTIMVVEPHKKL